MCKNCFLFVFFSVSIGCVLSAVVQEQIGRNQTDQTTQASVSQRCLIPKTAPLSIQNSIVECQIEIQIALLSDVVQLVESVKEEGSQKESRKKRFADTPFTEEEKKIAGCLLQCVYRKMKVVNEFGFPTVEGLVALYTEGLTDKQYIIGTTYAANTCLDKIKKDYGDSSKNVQETGKSCDVAFKTFECISEQTEEYCKQSP